MARGPLTADEYLTMKGRLGELGYDDDVTWALNACPPVDAMEFWREYAYVVCNSGMKATVARGIYERIVAAAEAGRPIGDAFGHRAKAAAMESVLDRREELLHDYLAADDKLAFLRGLPWIGAITCYHLAKNFGVDVAKPDRHLARLAALGGETAQELCERLSHLVGDPVRVVDVVLWRAAERGIIDTRSL